MRNISLVIETDYGGSAGCVLAREKAPEFLAGGFQFVFIESENSSVLNNSAAMARIVERMREAHTEFVSACLHPDRATLFIEEAWQAELPLKGRFMGSGPTIPEWVDNLGPMALDVLTFADWHHTINLTNLALFESVEEFVELLEGVDGKRVDFTFPAQTASFYVLMSAIQKAFEGCNTTETAGDVNLLLNDTSAISCDKGKALGYDRVLETLELSDFEGTILGPVKFDKNHRNIGLGSITIQVVNNSGSFETVVVLPLSIANSSHALKIPGSNPFKPERCPKGTFRGPDEFNPCPKCPPGTFSGEEGRDLCQECGSDEYTDRGEGQTGCIPCPENTERRAGGGFDFCEFRDSHGSIFCESCTLDLGDENITCLNCEETSSGDRARGVSICDCECVPGFYDPQRRAGRDCKECPDGAECEGHRELPYPLAGYWGNSSFRDEMYVCDLPKACKGGKNFSDLCTEEYTGRLCADCQSGYFKIVEHCFECMSTASTVMLMVIVFAMWLIINSVVALRVETVELMLNFVQLANIIGSLPLEWPKSLRQVFGVASILDFDVDVVEPSCFASWSFTNNFFVQLGLPIVMSFLALLWFLLGVLRFYTSKWYLQAHNHFVEWFRAATVYQWDVRRTSFRGESFISMEFDKFVAHCMAAIEVTYLTTTRYCLDVLACTDVAGVSVLTASPETVCGSDKHETLRGFAIAGLILYTGGYLAFVVFQLTTMQQTKSFKLSSNIRRYGFVYERFELEYTWTAVLTLLVRIFFVAAMVLVRNPLSAVGIIAVVTMVWLFVHVYTLPYVKDELDLLQSFFLVCLAAFAMSGLMFSCKNLPSTARTILTGGVLGLVFIMCTITFFFFLMEIFQKICIWVGCHIGTVCVLSCRFRW
ncbi:unnamed protein product [Ostreobium quekettii]|uniref:Tyrosine-protein kinase ephrin type A/B receptor-like domain-containing protein n=1 Tax=Ostreobium quekettii TaxID=121088 RepID=A0A8S1IZE5_9CHLO|nr:unnamed protein product [Ostreobium quekettii]